MGLKRRTRPEGERVVATEGQTMCVEADGNMEDVKLEENYWKGEGISWSRKGTRRVRVGDDD